MPYYNTHEKRVVSDAQWKKMWGRAKPSKAGMALLGWKRISKVEAHRLTGKRVNPVLTNPAISDAQKRVIARIKRLDKGHGVLMNTPKLERSAEALYRKGLLIERGENNYGEIKWALAKEHETGARLPEWAIPEYSFFVVVGDKLHSGWEYREDAREEVQELKYADLKGKVISRAAAIKKFRTQANPWMRGRKPRRRSHR